MSGRALVDTEDDEGDMLLAQRAVTCPRARDALTRRLGPRIRRLALSFLRNTDDAEDASQAALLAILHAMPSFRGESKLETWADRIAVRVALRMARTRRLAAVRSTVEIEIDELPAHGESTRVDELPRPLAAYLDALPEARRSVLVLRHALGYSLQEIAELTGVSINTVKDRLLCAREDVRKMVRRETAIGSAAHERNRRPS